MKAIICLLILMGFHFVIFAQKDDLKLEIKAIPDNEITLGEHVKISMRIHDPGLEDIVESGTYEVVSTAGLFKTNIPNSFNYIFYVVPKDTGMTKVGPFSLKYRGRQLESNTLNIKVTNNIEDKCIMTFVKSGNKVNSEGEIKFWGFDLDISELKLKKTDFMEVLSSNNSVSVSIEDGKQTTTYTKTFKVIFEKKGTFTIAPDLLGEYSKFFCRDPIEVTIK